MKKDDHSESSILVNHQHVNGSVAARTLHMIGRAVGDQPQSAVLNSLFSTSDDAWLAILTFKEDNITLYEFTSPNGQQHVVDVGNKLLDAIFGKIPNYFYFTPLNELQPQELQQ